jgi:hypothetical protein
MSSPGFVKHSRRRATGLPPASDLWVQASLNQKQRLQQLFIGDGVAFDGKQFVRTAVRADAFKYLTAVGSSQNEVSSLPGHTDSYAVHIVVSPTGTGFSYFERTLSGDLRSAA